jgi:hypothetical protein
MPNTGLSTSKQLATTQVKTSMAKTGIGMVKTIPLEKNEYRRN